MSSTLKILWVQDDFNGPMNGLAEYNGEKVWFSRQTDPNVISSTEVSAPYLIPDQEDCKNRSYSLFRLTPENLDAVIANHIKYCEEMGAPLNHGDPIRMQGKQVVKRLPAEKNAKVPLKMKTMEQIKRFNHNIIPSEIVGEIVAAVKESDFVNYHVPHRVV